MSHQAIVQILEDLSLKSRLQLDEEAWIRSLEMTRTTLIMIYV